MFVFAFLLMKKENVHPHQIYRRNLKILFINFGTEKKYQVWIFFKTIEFKMLTYVINIFCNIEGGESHEAP